MCFLSNPLNSGLHAALAHASKEVGNFPELLFQVLLWQASKENPRREELCPFLAVQYPTAGFIAYNLKCSWTWTSGWPISLFEQVWASNDTFAAWLFLSTVDFRNSALGHRLGFTLKALQRSSTALDEGIWMSNFFVLNPGHQLRQTNLSERSLHVLTVEIVTAFQQWGPVTVVGVREAIQ